MTSLRVAYTGEPWPGDVGTRSEQGAMRLAAGGVGALGDRYSTVRVLRSDHGTETRVVIDRERGDEAVVRIVSASTLGERRIDLEREAVLLRRVLPVGNQWLAPILDMGFVGDAFYVVRPFIAGIPLHERLAEGPLDVPDVLEMARCLLSVLADVHRQFVLHGGIKPANVILKGDRPLKEATLVDLGLPRRVVDVDSLRGPESDTARYIAPEQAGLLNRATGEQADLYCLGLVLFESLAGRSPFSGSTVSELLRHHLSTPAPTLRSLGLSVPGAVDDIVQRLLQKDPDDRYQSASAALADIEAVVRALARGEANPDVVVGEHDSRQTLAEPPLTGREAQLARLERHLEDARHGSGGLVIVEANSGGGKTRLLDDFCQSAAPGWVLRGQGAEGGIRQPLQVLSGVIADLASLIDSTPSLAATVRSRVGEAGASLGEVLPEVSGMLGLPQTKVGGREATALTRGVSAVVALLEALGSPDGPALVVLDDCQWADEFTLQVLAAWANRCCDAGQSRHHTLVVAAARPEDLPPDHLLRQVPATEHLALPPLNHNEIGQMVKSMAGPVPEAAVDAVAELSGGNPFMVSAVLRGLVEAGTLASNRSGWRFRPGGEQASREAAAILARRLQLLCPTTRRLLEAGAVIGREFDATSAAILALNAEVDGEAALAEAVKRHLVWQRSGGRYIFVHDRLREVVLASLEPVDLAHLHGRAAVEIEASDPSRAFELAYHFNAAGAPDRALNYALRSAEAARAAHDLQLAECQYRIAGRGTDGADDATRQAVAEGLGQVLMLRGRYDEAQEQFELARSYAREDMSQARIEGQLGEVLLKRDELERSAERIEAALGILGEPMPRRWGSLAFLLARELLLRLTSRAWRTRERRFTGGSSNDERNRLTAHLFTRLYYARWFHRGTPTTIWVMLRQLNVADRCPNTQEWAHAYSAWGAGLALMFPFLWRRALAHVERTAAFWQREGDLWGTGHALAMRACVLNAAGRWAEAVEAADEAIYLLARSGDLWESHVGARHRVISLYRLGRLREAATEAERLHRVASAIREPLAATTALEIWAKATGGRVPADLTEPTVVRAAEVPALQVAVSALQAEALRLRASGRLAEATVMLEQAVAALRGTWPKNTGLAAAFPWLATVHREAVETALLPAARRRLLRQARRSARSAVHHAWLYQNDRPHALREAAMVAALGGRRRRARRLFDRSLKIARRYQARGEQAETLLQRQRLGMSWVERGTGADPVGQQLLEAAEAFARQPTLGLAERFAGVLEAGARLVSATSSAEVTAAVRETALTLLRAEECVVRRASPLPGSPGQGDDAAAATALFNEASRRRRPFVVTDRLANAGGPPDGVDLVGVRSALCAPIFVRDELVAYFLAYHRQVGSLFGEEEERLAEFIAHLAGAALERERLLEDMRARVVAAQEAERSRVARDLHDEIGQILASVILGVRLMERSIESLGSSAADGLTTRTEEVRELVTKAIAEVHRLAFELRPSVLDDLGLAAAVRRLATEVTPDHGFTINVETVGVTSEDRLGPDIETTVYRVAQEALTNVVRHSGASACSIVVAQTPKSLRLVIEDDGAGFDPANGSGMGLGLRGMAERAALVGGTLTLSSVAGAGTEVLLEVPLG